MTHRRARTFLKLLPVTAVFASTHIALAAVPTTAFTVDDTETPIIVQQTLQSAVVQSIDPADLPPAAPIAASAPDARQVECMAKVILHEAGNQPLRGRKAVAQVIRARMNDGRFGDDACAVVRQPGQFFDVDAYRPSRTSDRWSDAVAIARETLNGEGEDVVPGALFFHSAGASMDGRTRLAQVADHTFYR